MSFAPKRVAVVGGGIMGGGIAAFFANRGVSVDLFDLNKDLADRTLARMADLGAKPPVLYSRRTAKRVATHGQDDLAAVAEADMIVEAVPEVLDIKREVFGKLDGLRKPGALVCTNTSGLSVAAMAEGRSEDFRACFLGTHYFNPVRFVHLVELIPGADTRPETVEELRAWFRAAGMRPVVGRDTPNFIANRVGVYAFMKAMRLMDRYGLTVEQVDMITGPPLGNPKTATFRLADMVGLDTLVHVARNAWENCPDDAERAVFEPPAWLQRMVESKLLGEKTGGGFYKKTREGIQTLDLASFEYRPRQDARADCVRVAKGHGKPLDRLRAMLTYPGAGDAEDPISSFARELVYSTGAYALNRVGEIAEDPAAIDEALRYGFNRELGPIESLDAVGPQEAVRGMRRFGIKVPALLDELAGDGHAPGRFADTRNGGRRVYDPRTRAMRAVDAPGDVLDLDRIKAAGGVVRENLSARLVDLGDGVLLFEPDSAFVPGINPIDDQLISMMGQALDVVHGGFRALVVGNQSANFSAGAQLQLILEASRAGRFDEIETLSRAFQYANLAFRRAPFPVVCAPHGMTLGGGMELTLAGTYRVCAAELYCGLVETGVGLLPAGGGCLFLVEQWQDTMANANPGPVPPVAQAFEAIAYAKVSTSAEHARELGLLDYAAMVEPSKERLLARAKAVAIEKCDGFRPRQPRELTLPGPGACRVLEATIDDLVTAGKITPHAARIAKVQARVLSGGETASVAEPVSEDRILELEREAFVSLCGEPLSQARMEHMLKTGKPLFN